MPAASVSSGPSGHYPIAGIPAQNAIVNGEIISVSASGRNAVTQSHFQSENLSAAEGHRGRVKLEDNSDEFVAEQMGTLALDDHGHLRCASLYDAVVVYG